MQRPAAINHRNGIAGWRNAFFCLLLMTFAAFSAWPQELAKDELGTTAGRTFSFQSFHGPQSITQSAEQIVGIGKVLWRTLRTGGARGSYFGKYEVIRVFDPSQTRLLGADIIVFDADAGVNTLENVQRIVAGYLNAAFDLNPTDAARLSALITKYNAAHRGDIAYLSQKYAPGVRSHVTAENAGIALSYTEWPGRTRLLIPLGHTVNGQPSVGVTSGQAGEAATPGQAGGAATFGRSAGAGPNGPAAGGAIATGGTGSSAQAGVTGAMSGTNSGAAGAAGSRIEGGATASAPPAAGAPATSSESKGVSSKTAAPGARREGAGSLGRFLFAGGLRWLILLLLVPVAILVFLVVRILRMEVSPAWAVAILRSAREGHPLVEMVVSTQNRRIGMRNVHYLPPGSSATVGGGRSLFLIYFVPVPRGMAILTYDGKKYTFVPRKVELFPSLAGPLVDCLGKTIPAKSTRGYPFTIVFRAFVSPLEEINRLMRSIRVPR
jgi:hypothetical protein